MLSLILFFLFAFDGSLLNLAKDRGVYRWAIFVLQYSTEVDRRNFNEENFLKHLESIKENLTRLPWGKDIPERLILNYVIPPRVSQEPLENFTVIYKDTLYNLVKDCKTINEAILRINEWCFSRIEYRPTDPWDQSALATLKRGFGRCEEMTILFMKALRTVGIPVRYVFTPWWPFTESNHAWVEVWTEEGWKFLGSAEPTDFNFGWFREPAKRTAMVQSVVFGKPKSLSTGESVLLQKKNYSLLNVTSNYTKPFTLIVEVKDLGKPAKNVSFSINVWNYSAFVPVFSCTLKAGYGVFELGRTDLLIFARRENKIAYAFVEPRSDTLKISLDLCYCPFPSMSLWLRTIRVEPDTEKPVYHPNMDSLITLRKELHSLLEFPFKDSVADSALLKIFESSRGNWPSLWYFFKSHLDKSNDFKYYLSKFYAKDLVMMDTANLYEEFLYLDSARVLSSAPPDLFDSLVVPPRIYYEEFSLWRKTLFNTFRKLFLEEGRQGFQVSEETRGLSKVKPLDEEENVEKFLKWTLRNIKRKNYREFFKPFQSPLQTLSLKSGSDREIYVFIVAVLRTFGIPAKLKDTYDGIEYFVGKWKEFSFEGKGTKQVEKYEVELSFLMGDVNVTKDMKYYYNYSIHRFESFPERLDLDPAEEDSVIRLKLGQGRYYVMYGFRNVFGDAYIKVRRFSVPGDRTIKVDVTYPVEKLSPGDLIVRDFKVEKLDSLKIVGDVKTGNLFISYLDLSSEISRSSINSAIPVLKNFTGRWLVITSAPEVAYEYFKGYELQPEIYMIDETVLKELGIHKVPSFVLILNGKVVLFTEGLVLNLGDLISKLTPR